MLGGGFGRRVVGVHLIAEHHDQVRPVLDGLVEHSQTVGPQRIDADPSLVLVGTEVEGWLVRSRRTAAPEQHPGRAGSAERADDTRWDTELSGNGHRCSPSSVTV